MAVALTVIEVVLAIGGVVKGLYDYTSSVKDAKDDIRKLAQELFALKGALEHFDLHEKNDLDDAMQSQVRDMLLMTKETLDSIHKRLEQPKSGIRKVTKSLAWPFRSAEIEKHLGSIERAKTWFIMVILKDSSDITLAVFDEMKKLNGVVHELVLGQRTTTMLKETEELLAWLSPFNSEELLVQAVHNKSPGTGQWIFDAQFAQWLDPNECKRPFTWITGKSGSGKTVLFSSIIDKLRCVCSAPETPNRFFGYHCCSLDHATSQQISNVFGSVLAQIGRIRPNVLQAVTPHRNSTSSSLVTQNNLEIAQINSIISTIVRSFDCLYVLVDALNETPHSQALITALLQLCEQHPKIRVLVTCTTTPSVTSPLVRERMMRTDSVDHDIELYVQHKLNTESSLRALSPSIQTEIRNKIISAADGMFRWADLCMGRLKNLRTGRDVRDALADMPTSLNDTYVRILDRIAEHDRPLAREALLWLCFSLRPLSLHELAEAVVLRESDSHIDDDCRLTNPAAIIDICQGLAVWNRDAVTLAHDSVRSFLTAKFIRTTSAAFFALDAEEAHSCMMRKCLAYLSLDAFTTGPVDDYVERKATHPLINYATMFWPIHSEQYPLPAADETLILDFFATKRQPGGSSFESWVQLLLNTGSLQPIRQTEPLYYAASFNMLSILKLLVRPENGVDLNRRGGRFASPPLFVAIWRRNFEAARVLIEAGADVHARDGQFGEGMNCRELALMKRQYGLVQRMLAKHPDAKASLELEEFALVDRVSKSGEAMIRKS